MPPLELPPRPFIFVKLCFQIRRIRETETLDIDSRVTTFAKSLFDKVPRSSSATSSVGEKRRQENRAREREALVSQSKRYAMVDSDDEETTLKIQPKKAKKAKKEKRKKESDSDEDEFSKVRFFIISCFEALKATLREKS